MMKKTGWITLAVAGMFFYACGSGETKESGGKSPQSTQEKAKGKEEKASNPNANNPDYKKGLALIAGSDCLTCHKIDTKMIGPSYKDIADKYEATDDNIKLLAGKIIKGGSGVWGDVPMTPHAGISQADAEMMVKYIFLLKSKK